MQIMKECLHAGSFLLASLPNQLTKHCSMQLLSSPLQCSNEDIPCTPLQGGLIFKVMVSVINTSARRYGRFPPNTVLRTKSQTEISGSCVQFMDL